MLAALKRKALPIVCELLALHSLYSAHNYRAFQAQVDLLLQNNRNAILRDFESLVSPAACIVAEKSCNFRLFDRILQDRDVGLMTLHKDRLLLDAGLTQSYVLGRSLPEHYRYYILSPYIGLAPFSDRRHFRVEYKVLDRVRDDTKRTFFDLVRFLDQSSYSSYKRDGLHFAKTHSTNFTHIKVHLGILGGYEQTKYKSPSRIMANVQSLARELYSIKKDRTPSSFMTEVTQRLLGQLSSLGIFRDGADLEAFPDLVPLLFPFRMLDPEYSRPDSFQLVTIGFDLRSAAQSHLGFLFDSKRVNAIVGEGGVYICTVVA